MILSESLSAILCAKFTLRENSAMASACILAMSTALSANSLAESAALSARALIESACNLAKVFILSPSCLINSSCDFSSSSATQITSFTPFEVSSERPVAPRSVAADVPAARADARPAGQLYHPVFSLQDCLKRIYAEGRGPDAPSRRSAGIGTPDGIRTRNLRLRRPALSNTIVQFGPMCLNLAAFPSPVHRAVQQRLPGGCRSTMCPHVPA